MSVYTLEKNRSEYLLPSLLVQKTDFESKKWQRRLPKGTEDPHVRDPDQAEL